MALAGFQMLVSLVLLSLQIDSPQPLSACSRMSRILSGNHGLESLNGQMSVETEIEAEREGKVEDAVFSCKKHRLAYTYTQKIPHQLNVY